MDRLLNVIGKYILNWLIHFDIGVNVLFGGCPYETLSSRFDKGRDAGIPFYIFMAKLVDLIFKVLINQDDHCNKSRRYCEGDRSIID